MQQIFCGAHGKPAFGNNIISAECLGDFSKANVHINLRGSMREHLWKLHFRMNMKPVGPVLKHPSKVMQNGGE